MVPAFNETQKKHAQLIPRVLNLSVGSFSSLRVEFAKLYQIWQSYRPVIRQLMFQKTEVV